MMKISVKSVDFRADSKLIGYVEQKISRLERYYDKPVEAEVHLKVEENGRKVREKVAEIRLLLPGGVLVDKKSGKTFETAVNAMVETLKRQLVRFKEKNGEKQELIN
jgi:putative sigma-54 modulation protein